MRPEGRRYCCFGASPPPPPKVDCCYSSGVVQPSVDNLKYTPAKETRVLMQRIKSIKIYPREKHASRSWSTSFPRPILRSRLPQRVSTSRRSVSSADGDSSTRRYSSTACQGGGGVKGGEDRWGGGSRRRRRRGGGSDRGAAVITECLGWFIELLSLGFLAFFVSGRLHLHPVLLQYLFCPYTPKTLL